MPLTPEDVRNKEFRYSFRGYNEEEVDAFLDEVEAEVGRLLTENNQLRQRAAAPPAPAPAGPAQAPMSETEEMLRRTLLIAQRTADETVAQAKAEADKLLADARNQSEAMISSAQQQASAQLGDLDNRRRALEQHIESLRGFEREYRTRLKAYLEAQLRDLDSRSASGSTPAGQAPGAGGGQARPADAAQRSAPPADGQARPAADATPRPAPDAAPSGEPPRVAQ